MRKDVWVMRWPLAAYILAALAALALTVTGGSAGRSAGITLALNVLIGVSFHVMLVPVLGEREPDRAALLMRAHDQMSYEDIAFALRISVGAAKVRVHRARRKVAELRMNREVPSS